MGGILMSNSPKSSLELVSNEITESSAATVIEVLPEECKKDTSSKTVLIKHDYYSSDTVHGRELLSSFLSSLRKSSYTSLIIYLVDSGTLLLDRSNPLFEQMRLLSANAEMIVAADESIAFYGIEDSGNPKVIVQSMDLITEDLICLSDILILE
jgi:hypothetical protein